MKEISVFNPTRFLLLTRNDLWLIWMRVAVFIGSSLGIFIIILVIIVLHEEKFEEKIPNIPHEMAFLIVFVVLIPTAVVTFKEFHKTEDSYAWLTLPGSLLEKYANRLLLTSLGYYLIFTISYTLFFAIFDTYFRLFYNSTGILFNPFGRIVLDYLSLYLAAHALVLVGALYFKPAGFIIALSTIMGFVIPLYIIAVEVGMTDSQLEIIKILVYVTDRIPLWGVITPICWVVGYYLLKRKEA